MDVFHVWNHTQDGDAANIFHHLTTLFEQAHITTELIDDDALYHLAVFGCLECYAAIDGGKHAPSVNVAHKDDVSLGVACHW